MSRVSLLATLQTGLAVVTNFELWVRLVVSFGRDLSFVFSDIFISFFGVALASLSDVFVSFFGVGLTSLAELKTRTQISLRDGM